MPHAPLHGLADAALPWYSALVLGCAVSVSAEFKLVAVPTFG